MTGISTFANPEFGQIRAIKGDKENPLFVASDVASTLGYSNPRDAVARHCRGVVKHDIPTTSGIQSISLIPESDLYRLIMKSKMPKAEEFQDWVTEDILPTIRKTGGYMVARQDESPEDVMARAVMIAQETLQRRELRIKVLESENSFQSTLLDEQVKIINEQKPKALFADAVSTSSDSILIGEMAIVLKQNGIEIGQNRFFEWLRENGYLCSHGEKWNLPTQRSMDLKIMVIKERTHNEPDGTVRVTRTSKITGKGQQYFVNKFLSMQQSA